jgi:hypothetical protein
VSSNFDPVDITEYTKAEIKAAVADAENCDTSAWCTTKSCGRGSHPLILV